MADQDFSLNVNKISQVQVVTEAPRMSADEDIYDLRRQIDARQTVKDYIRTEILRLQALLESMTHDIITLDLKLRDRKPAGEPRQKRYLYKPGTAGQYQLGADESGAIEGELVNESDNQPQ